MCVYMRLTLRMPSHSIFTNLRLSVYFKLCFQSQQMYLVRRVVMKVVSERQWDGVVIVHHSSGILTPRTVRHLLISVNHTKDVKLNIRGYYTCWNVLSTF